jgi:hypothetical protein
MSNLTLNILSTLLFLGLGFIFIGISIMGYRRAVSKPQKTTG